jgi:hypothetical protein
VRGAFDVASEDVIDATDFFRAEYSGLIAAPGMPKAVSTPSRRITRTAASIALILLMVLCLFTFCNCIQVALRRVYSRRTAQVNPFSQAAVSFVGSPFTVAFRRMWRFSKLLYTKNNSLCSICGIGLRHKRSPRLSQ